MSNESTDLSINAISIPLVKIPTTGSIGQNTESTKGFWPAFFAIVFFCVFGIIAIVLSWDCNSKLGYNIWWKLLFMIGAFVMNAGYIFYYALSRGDVCKHCARKVASTRT